MFLEHNEVELLRLCGISRYMPCSFVRKFDLSVLDIDRVNALLRTGHIKVIDGSRECYRLTRRGRSLLYDAGYVYPDDIRPHKQGKALDRRVINAGFNVLLYGAGINIFAEKAEMLGREDYSYISSLTIRADTKSKVLAGTRFYGILRIRDTVYVLYYSCREISGIIPDYEERTFMNIISEIENVRHIAIIVASATEEELSKYALTAKKQSQRGMVAMSEVMERWQYDFYLLPVNRDGVLQMRFMMMNNGGKEIASLFGDTDNVPIGLNQFDAVKGEQAYITAVDMDITRVKRALEQSLYANATPNIICLPYQQGIYKQMVIQSKYPKQMKFTVINRDKLSKQFPELGNPEENIRNAKDVKGGYVRI